MLNDVAQMDTMSYKEIQHFVEQKSNSDCCMVLCLVRVGTSVDSVDQEIAQRVFLQGFKCQDGRRGVRGFQGSVDSIVRRRLREVQSRGAMTLVYSREYQVGQS